MAEDELGMLISRPLKLQETETARKERERAKERHAQTEALFIEMIIEKAKRDCISYPYATFSQGHRWGFDRGKNFKMRYIVRNLINAHLPLEMIITSTGLTREEVEGLCN